VGGGTWAWSRRGSNVGVGRLGMSLVGLVGLVYVWSVRWGLRYERVVSRAWIGAWGLE
jgi:hypothetical protein